MAKADLFIINGLGLETYADSIQNSINVKTVCATDGIETRTVDGVTDPHVWLSLKNAEKMLKNIADALSAADSANADFYNENYEKYAVLFDALDAEYSSVLSACSRKDIVTAHAAFGYLCADYGLTQVPIEGLSAESEPDAAKMAEILDYVKNNGVTTIFYEELISPTVAESIATQTGAVTAVLNPLEGLSDADVAAGYDYLTEMADNLISLSKALGRAQ
jgi:zinc transport system substrate-binding protein